ncbi:MAG: hypothetical protein MZU97_22990 [Bacillus subtilis]|nr:hypothetical protein [Bacillus subtilis]
MRSKIIYLDIHSIYAETTRGVIKYVLYADLAGSFEIEDALIQAIWGLINQEHNQAMTQLFQAEIARKAMAFSMFEYDKKIKMMTKSAWI